MDPGESDALAHAVEVPADAVLLDETAGRLVARRLGLTTIGVVGGLARAKTAGHLPAITPLLDRLEAEANFSPSRQRLRVFPCCHSALPHDRAD